MREGGDSLKTICDTLDHCLLARKVGVLTFPVADCVLPINHTGKTANWQLEIDNWQCVDRSPRSTAQQLLPSADRLEVFLGNFRPTALRFENYFNHFANGARPARGPSYQMRDGTSFLGRIRNGNRQF